MPELADQLQMHLVDKSKYENENDDYRWILTAIEILSHYVFAIPGCHKHKDFMEPAVKRLLEQFKERFGKYPNIVQFDDGGEFYNTKVLPFLKSKNICYFSTQLTSKKAAIIERFNRTLKQECGSFLTIKEINNG